MISIKKYLTDPCNLLSIPYWKAKKTSIRSDMMIVHNSKFDEFLYRDWKDTKYFRIKHDLIKLTSTSLDERFFYKTVVEDDIEDVVNVINQSYSDIEVTKKDVSGWMREESYCKDLWILLYSKKNYKVNKITKEKKFLPVGLIISNCDNATKEASIEWLQIIPSFRKLGLATSLIKESLLRMSCIADFATVSGKVDSPDNVITIYKKCGFEGDAIWHVLRKIN